MFCISYAYQALVMCLESGDYIQIRNAILILQGIIQRFPAITNLAAVIEKRIEKVSIVTVPVLEVKLLQLCISHSHINISGHRLSCTVKFFFLTLLVMNACYTYTYCR